MQSIIIGALQVGCLKFYSLWLLNEFHDVFPLTVSKVSLTSLYLIFHAVFNLLMIKAEPRSDPTGFDCYINLNATSRWRITHLEQAILPLSAMRAAWSKCVIEDLPPPEPFHLLFLILGLLSSTHLSVQFKDMNLEGVVKDGSINSSNTFMRPRGIRKKNVK